MNIKKHGFLSFPFGNKKGADLPINTIIIAAIVLIVLVVLWAIFTGRMGVFSTGLKKEESKECVKDLNGNIQEPPCPVGKNAIKTTDAIGTMVCCV